ncbi:hypothetical protein [Leptotrichia sp. oral taxon 223]|uniref:hypothetical protein n=1 Tax=Leptotrichia sp. oral taxon 223 TaxID=712363 RepID=UPI0015BDF4C0|nr:hypothetical protein [Leptotrichia sp. oral taxon 223]NWO18058.1 hypothetical protein [Leptotrichia sp. oral taxon 223]
MREAAAQNLGNAKSVTIQAFGDERYLGLAGNTHGRYTYEKNMSIEKINEDQEKGYTYFRTKKSKPSEKAVNIRIDYFKLFERDREKEMKLTSEEQLKLYKEQLEELGKKYKMTTDQVRKEMEEFDKYSEEDIVEDAMIK